MNLNNFRRTKCDYKKRRIICFVTNVENSWQKGYFSVISVVQK